MASPHIQFRAVDLMAQALEQRTTLYEGLTPGQKSGLLSETARRDLDRYYELLRRSLPRFSLGEAMLMCDVFNGTMHMPFSVSLLWAEVSDALEDGYVEKWQEIDATLDGPALVAKLRALTPFECMAVADAVERAWNDTSYRVKNMQEKVQAVGLVVREKEELRSSQED